MGMLKTGASALGKLIMVALLAAAFVAGMIGTVWLSLRGEEIQVPEIVGKDFNESEKELAALGLKLKRRSYRYSEEKPNTVIEQAPKAGDTVKTGHQILVVVSQENPEGTEAPATLKKDGKDEVETLDSNSSDKPKSTNKNTGGKKPEKTRDVISNKSNKNANAGNSNGNSSNSSNSKSNSNNGGGSDNKNSTAPSTSKTPNPAKTPAAKPNDKPPAAGDTRNRRVP
ncbi:MAG TPA: PASTA domain-containing protein [Pyrinomonadaceae bacterium]|nr:PASTA domain-containing protein [Pyrinomonadaceae bacterium]